MPPTAEKYPSTWFGLRQLTHERCVVRRVQRREHALDDVAADRAEVQDHAGARRPAEAVVVHDDRGLPPAELLVRDLADARVPLGTVAVIAEQVLRSDLHRRILRPGGADDERLRRMRLGVVGHVHGLVAGQRSDHHVRTELLHQTLRLGDGHRHGVVSAAVADDVHGRAADLDAGHARRRLRLVLRHAVRVLRERCLRSADVELVAEAEGSLAVGHDRELDRGCVGRGERGRRPDRDCGHGDDHDSRGLPAPQLMSPHLWCPPPSHVSKVRRDSRAVPTQLSSG